MRRVIIDVVIVVYGEMLKKKKAHLESVFGSLRIQTSTRYSRYSSPVQHSGEVPVTFTRPYLEMVK